MKCPYCGYSKTKSNEESFKVYTCPRCDYLFEISVGEYLLEKILSIPFSSLIYTPIILTINYYLARYSFQENGIAFGIFVAFHNLMVAFVLLFILFITSGRKSRIFLIKSRRNQGLFDRIKEISPLVKISLFLFISAVIFPFVLS